MHPHLQLARAFRSTFQMPIHQTELSDMDIILNQAALMEKGSALFKALKLGDMPIILLRFVGLAYAALEAIAQQTEDLVEHPVIWRHDGSVLSIMRLLSEHINHCQSGKTADYASLYCICAHLTSSFLNADFNSALTLYHHYQIQHSSVTATGISIAHGLDLSECLYE